MKASVVAALVTFVPVTAYSYCGANYQACPDPPTPGACANNCYEGNTSIQPGVQNNDNAYTLGSACVTIPGNTKVKDVGWGIYNNPAGGSWWQYRGMTSSFKANGQKQFCINGANQASFERALYIRVWTDE